MWRENIFCLPVRKIIGSIWKGRKNRFKIIRMGAVSEIHRKKEKVLKILSMPG